MGTACLSDVIVTCYVVPRAHTMLLSHSRMCSAAPSSHHAVRYGEALRHRHRIQSVQSGTVCIYVRLIWTHVFVRVRVCELL